MKFLLVAKQQRHAAAYVETLRRLVERGHQVVVAVQDTDDGGDRRLASQIDSTGFRVVSCPAARIDEWSSVALTVRRLRDCMHYLKPPFVDSPALQIRFTEKLRDELQLEAATEVVLTALRAISAAQIGRLEAMLRLAEQSIPTSSVFDRFVQSESPDVLLVSPLVHFGPAQADVVASARRLGIPVWMLLFSWDNLSTKGCMHVEPDLMFVWNERQRVEAQHLHGFPSSRVVVVGAPRFDAFFQLRPMMTPEEFHQPLGLDPLAPTLLYLCSSVLVVPHELPFVRRWLAALRESPCSAARKANVVVRPHPAVRLLPEEVPLERHGWPAVPDLVAAVARPFDDRRAIVLQTPHEDPRGLHESLVHSSAVVALNTTAELEAGIVGRPVFTIQPDTRDGGSHQATLHFHYLTRGHGGFVSAASSLEEHLQQLEEALTVGVDPVPIRSFIEAFLRPHGIDRPVLPLLADALEQHATSPEARRTRPTTAAPLESRAPSAGSDGVVPLSYQSARILVHATPEAMRDVGDDGTIRLDRATVKWLERWVRSGDVVYDVNAGFGPYALLAARQRGAVVVAFEPNHRLHAALCDNVVLNVCQESVIPVPLALGSRNAFAKVRCGRGRTVAGQSLCSTRMDTVVECYGLPPVTHLRVSPRVSTLDVLEGAAGTLAHPALRTILLQVLPEHEPAVVDRLAATGLKVARRRLRRRSVQILFSRPDGADGAERQ